MLFEGLINVGSSRPEARLEFEEKDAAVKAADYLMEKGYDFRFRGNIQGTAFCIFISWEDWSCIRREE